MDKITQHVIDESTLREPVTTKYTMYQATVSDSIIECSGTFTVTLPYATTCIGEVQNIKNIGTGIITVSGKGGELIDGAVSFNLTDQYASATVVSNGTSWSKLGSSTAGLVAGSTSVGVPLYNGTSAIPGGFYGGTSDPVATTRLNYDGSLHVTNLHVSNDSVVLTSTGDVTVEGNLTVNGTLTTLRTDLAIEDKLITLNKGGGASSAAGTGIEFEENSSITGYIKVDSAEDKIVVKAPTGSILTLDVNAGKTLTIAGDLNVSGDSAINQSVTTSASPSFTEVTANGITVADTGFQLTRFPTGFPNRTDTTLSFTVLAPARTFTITGTNFNVYSRGKKYTKNTESIQLDAAANLYYIYYTSTGTLSKGTSMWSLVDGTIPIATVYWNTSTGLIGDERHGTIMDGATHEYLHETVGTRYVSGLAGTFNAPTTTDPNISIGLGHMHDEDIELLISDQTTCKVFYKLTSTYYCTVAQTTYYHKVANVLQYNLSGTSLSNVTANRYVAYWIFATNDPTTPIYSLMGQREDNTIANARTNNTYDTLSLGTLPFAEMKLLYRVILQRSGTNAIYQEAADYRTVSNLPAGTYVATLHSSLTGLNSDDHNQYALLAGRSGDTLKIDTISEVSGGTNVTIGAGTLKVDSIAERTTSTGVIVSSSFGVTGTSQKTGQFYAGTTAPTTSTGRVNFGGKLYATEIQGKGSTIFTVTQASHGFSILSPIYHNGTNWQLARADLDTTVGTHVVVGLNGNDFTACSLGKISNINTSSLTAGAWYFVSTSTGGALTSTEPIIGYSNPILYCETSNATTGVIHVVSERPSQSVEETSLTTRYTTGWILATSWTSKTLGDSFNGTVSHNFNKGITELDVKVFVSSAGSDATAYELINNPQENYGITITQTSSNVLTITTGASGVTYVSAGTVTVVPDSWYYKVIVYKVPTTHNASLLNISDTIALSYDTGWLSSASWQGVSKTITHSLGVDVADLLVKVYINSSGTTTGAYWEYGQLWSPYFVNVDSDGQYLVPVNTNSFNLYSTSSGLIRLNSDKTTTTYLNGTTAYYRVVVYKIPTQGRVSVSSVKNILQGLFGNIYLATGTYQALITDYIIVGNSTSAFTITLPQSVLSTGQILKIKNINTGVVTIDGYSSELIDASSTIALNQWESLYLVCNGTGWYYI